MHASIGCGLAVNASSAMTTASAPRSSSAQRAFIVGQVMPQMPALESTFAMAWASLAVSGSNNTREPSPQLLAGSLGIGFLFDQFGGGAQVGRDTGQDALELLQGVSDVNSVSIDGEFADGQFV